MIQNQRLHKAGRGFKRILHKLAFSNAFWLLMCAILVSGLFYSFPSIIMTSTGVYNGEMPVYRVETTEKKLALSFDCEQTGNDTSKILEILAEHQVKATFFVTGEWVDSHPEEVKAIAAAGHDLGNHSNTHANMTQLNGNTIQEEIMTAHAKVKALTGVEMNLFRVPYGEYNNQIILTAMSCGYYPIQWSIDSLDWKDYGAPSIIKTVCENKELGNGSIILMHNGTSYTTEALSEMLTLLKEQGYELIPVSELIYKENYTVDDSGRQSLNGL